MARSYSGREWKCLLGVTDLSASALGAGTDDANPLGTITEFRVDNPVSDFAWDAGYQRAEIERAGRRTLMAEDVINQYGGGTWTWDFNYVAENERALQILLQLIYPQNGVATTSLTIPADPVVDDMSKGAATGDSVGFVILSNPLTTKDHYMHSAVLQSLTISMDANTNGGRPTISGQFMSGFKPIIEANSVAADGTADNSDWAKGLFDCSTSNFNGAGAIYKSFSVTIENPATRTGWQGASGECDGYTRASALKVTGSCSLKADATIQGYLESVWQANATTAIALGDGSLIDFSIPAANMSAFALDMADDGMFADISWSATSGADGSGNLAVIKLS